jgi:hypothetical protein
MPTAPTLPLSPRDQAVALLTWVRTVSNKLIGDWPADKTCHQNCPADNHPTWVLGHLASTDAWLGSELGFKASVPANYKEFFGGGSKPNPDPSKYPPFAEVKKHFDGTRAALIQWLKTAPDAALTKDLKEKTGGFTTDPIDAMHKVAWHEGLHMGQVATLRKSLGLPSVMGG